MRLRVRAVRGSGARLGGRCFSVANAVTGKLSNRVAWPIERLGITSGRVDVIINEMGVEHESVGVIPIQ